MSTRFSMVSFAIGLVVALSTTASAQAPPPLPPPPELPVMVDRAQVEPELDRMMERLAAVRALLDAPMTRKQQNHAIRELERTRAQVVGLRRLFRRSQPVPWPPAVLVQEQGIPTPAPVIIEDPSAQAPTPQPMPPDSFERALASVKKHGFDDAKLGVVGEIASTNWFITGQVKRLLALFSFDEGRLKALRLVAPRILDVENNFVLFEAFSFDDDKKKARAILRRTH